MSNNFKFYEENKTLKLRHFDLSAYACSYCLLILLGVVVGVGGSIRSDTIPFSLPLLIKITDLFEMHVWEVCSNRSWTPRNFLKCLFHNYILADMFIINW